MLGSPSGSVPTSPSSSLSDDVQTGSPYPMVLYKPVPFSPLFIAHTQKACAIIEKVCVRLSSNLERTNIAAEFYINTNPHESRRIFGSDFYEILKKTLHASTLVSALLKSCPNLFVGRDVALHIKMLEKVFIWGARTYAGSETHILERIRESLDVIDAEITYLQSPKSTEPKRIKPGGDRLETNPKRQRIS